MPTSFEVSPVKLIYGGEALSFHDNQTVFSPLVLPGERVEVEEVRRQKGVVYARPLRIIEPSPQRIEPFCPHFTRCGGCQYQHFPHAAQVEAKSEILRETLRRIGQIKWDGPIPAHSGPARNYRNQAQLKVGAGHDGALSLGFFEAESNRLIPIDACPILSPRLNEVLTVLRSEPWIQMLFGCREVELFADDRDGRVMLTLTGIRNEKDGAALAQRCMAEIPGVSTVAIARDTGVRVYGEPHLTYRVGDFAYRVSPTAFFQSARFLLPEMVKAVTAGVTGSVALDFFAGVGLFTLPLAARFHRVIAVESHPQAAADLADNAGDAPRNNIRAVAGTMLDFLRRYTQTGPDLVIMDPPRAGVGAAPLKLLVDLRPKRLHYVSCSPPTLARDLGFLIQHGYQIDGLEMFDFFPQTYHIEAVVRMSRVG